jgi:orotate phosphoribosyltransferase
VIDDALCVVDRGEGGAEYLATHGLRMRALFTAEDLKVAARDLSRSRTPTTR